MHPAKERKVVITGTGRAGTTFLVRLLTELGLDTGFDRKNWRASYDEHCHAGLEHAVDAAGSPYIVKNPEFCRTLPVLLAAGEAPAIDHVLIPVRDLQAAARSRIRIGGADGEIPGGLWLTSDPERQAAALAVVFFELLHALVVHDVPHTLLPFPRFVMDAEFTYSKLKFLLGPITLTEFKTAFARVSEPGLIHVYAADDSLDRSVAQAYRARQAEALRKAERRRELRRRFGIAAGLLATVGFGGFLMFGGR
ncbi:hypothetical protein DB347_21135 [Opitutaceae bacterium EW11]|nr:hypothetical protein DB347_21135 [Opitutaceae bacterium EW11]